MTLLPMSSVSKELILDYSNPLASTWSDQIEHFRRGKWTGEKATTVSHSFILVSEKDMPMIQAYFQKMMMNGNRYSIPLPAAPLNCK